MRIKPYLPYIGIAAFALLVAILAAYLSLENQIPVPRSGPTTTIVLLRPGKLLPTFSLQGDDGKPFTRASLTGHWSLLYFGYTHCPDVCPVTLADLAQMATRLQDLPAADRPHVYFISVDPKRDTLPALQQYVRNFDADFAAATGEVPELEIISKALGVDFSYQPADQAPGYSVNHSVAVLVIDPEARETAVYTPPLIPARMADDYRFILKLHGAQP
ncbi:MAG: SCO family protein [Gammaproteobacteria bacterium]